MKRSMNGYMIVLYIVLGWGVGLEYFVWKIACLDFVVN
jgi:hypothetical protein